MTLKDMTREEWLQLRKNHVGGSDAPVIMNDSHFNKTPFKLWQEKLGLYEDNEDNWGMQKGRLLEEPARQAYEKYTNQMMNPEIVFHSDHKFMMATLDGLSHNADIAVEIKHVGEEDHELAKKKKVPQKYYPQLQHQLACLGHDLIHYFSYKDGEGVIVEVGRDNQYLENLYEKEWEFWNRVLNLTAPDLTIKDYRDLSDDPVWREKAAKWVETQQVLNKLEKEQKKLREWLISYCEGQSSKGAGVKVQRIIRKGNVDYKSIPELQGVDLDKYRKPPQESWRLEANK